ncbi:MAG: phosphoenolpyruvate--protein phosphotransferase [Moorellaceae bacterium]
MLKGLPISPGIGIGRIWRLSGHPAGAISKTNLKEEEIAEELARLEAALKEAQEEMQRLAVRAREEVGPKEAQIFEAHLLILKDPTLVEKITSKIKEEKKNASWAVAEAVEEVARTFEVLEEEYFRSRAVDIRDIGERLIACLEGENKTTREIPPQAIIAAVELTPSQTASFSAEKVKGIITEKGGSTSHAAIVARALGIPCVSGIPGLMARVEEGQLAAVDGIEGVIYLNPTEDLVSNLEEKKRVWEEQQRFWSGGGPALTQDGRKVELAANIREPREVERALEQGAEGIGLLRTEFLFMGRTEPPGEEEQFEVYRKVLTLMEGKPVIVRTLDIGGDKPLPYLHATPEENPFLGLRGLRLTLKHRELFKTQLKALLRASLYGNLKIMYPMVASIAEIREARKILEEAREEVDQWRPVEIGVMIETPAAALTADVLAREVDFFSIGTNDLTQYTLAVDRGNEEVMALYDPFHPAVLRLIYHAVESAHRYNKWVGLCGEMGGEVAAVPLLVGLGLDELSMSPLFIPQIRQAVLQLSFEKARGLALKALEASCGQEVRDLLASEGK